MTYRSIVPGNILAMFNLNFNEDDVIYCMKLTSISNRRVASADGGFFAGIGNAINNTFSGVMQTHIY